MLHQVDRPRRAPTANTAVGETTTKAIPLTTTTTTSSRSLPPIRTPTYTHAPASIRTPTYTHNPASFRTATPTTPSQSSRESTPIRVVQSNRVATNTAFLESFRVRLRNNRSKIESRNAKLNTPLPPTRVGISTTTLASIRPATLIRPLPPSRAVTSDITLPTRETLTTAPKLRGGRANRTETNEEPNNDTICYATSLPPNQPRSLMSEIRQLAITTNKLNDISLTANLISNQQAEKQNRATISDNIEQQQNNTNAIQSPMTYLAAASRNLPPLNPNSNFNRIESNRNTTFIPEPVKKWTNYEDSFPRLRSGKRNAVLIKTMGFGTYEIINQINLMLPGSCVMLFAPRSDNPSFIEVQFESKDIVKIIHEGITMGEQKLPMVLSNKQPSNLMKINIYGLTPDLTEKPEKVMQKFEEFGEVKDMILYRDTRYEPALTRAPFANLYLEPEDLAKANAVIPRIMKVDQDELQLSWVGVEPICRYCKEVGHYKNNCASLRAKIERQQMRLNRAHEFRARGQRRPRNWGERPKIWVRKSSLPSDTLPNLTLECREDERTTEPREDDITTPQQKEYQLLEEDFPALPTPPSPSNFMDVSEKPSSSEQNNTTTEMMSTNYTDDRTKFHMVAADTNVVDKEWDMHTENAKRKPSYDPNHLYEEVKDWEEYSPGKFEEIQLNIENRAQQERRARPLLNK